MPGKIKILVVDDEERFLKTLTQRLEMRDFEVTAVTNGQDALKTIKEKEFDLALLDLKMPGMTGEQLLSALKKEAPLVEAVILTGHGSIDSAVYCTTMGSYSYLQKPCETEDLLEVLKNAYQKRIQKKLQIDQERMEKLLNLAMGDSALGVMRRLKQLEEEKAVKT